MKKTTRLAFLGAWIAGTAIAAGTVQPALAAPGTGDAAPRACSLSQQQTPVADADAIFVSPDGDDAATGTKDAPFRTFMRAQEAAQPGDTVYIRGGVYNEFTISQTDNPHENVYHFVNDIYKSGITYAAYPGDERPLFDFSSVPTDQRVAAFYIGEEITDVTFAGFDVTGVKVGAQKQSEVFRIGGGANFENMAAYDNEGPGFYYTAQGTGYVINSDSYNNVGPTNTSAGNGDGFGAHGNNVWFIGNRAWANSDDGYDNISSTGRVAYINSWSFDHHGNADGVGDKNGFKVGGYAYRVEGLPDPLPLHLVVNDLAVDNGANNFYANHQPGQSAYWLGNTADKPGYGSNFNMLERVSPTSPDNIPGYREVLHGNIAYTGVATSENAVPAEQQANNSWTLGITPAADDFVSTDQSQLTAPRDAAGRLPEVDYLRPVAGGELEGLGYLANNDACGTLSQVVDALTQSGDISSQGVSRALQAKLDAGSLDAFVAHVADQRGDHISDYAADTLSIVAYALSI